MDSKDNRGVIVNRERRKQIIDFSGIRYGNITPTDCDGLIEYRDKAFMYIEIKHRTANIPRGQRIALERMTDSNTKSGKWACVVVCEHYIDDCKEDVDAALCTVREVYWKGKWWNYRKSGMTLKRFTDSFISRVDGKPF